MACIQEHAVALGYWIDALLPNHGCNILGIDNAGIVAAVRGRYRQPAAAVRHSIEQHAAAYESDLSDVLDTQRAHAIAADVRVLEVATVVEEMPFGSQHANVAWPVELRPYLPDLGRQVLVVIDNFLLPERATGRQTRNGQSPPAAAKCGRILLVNLAQRGYLALPDELGGT